MADLNFVRNPQLREGFKNIFDQAEVGRGKNLFVDTVNGRAGNDGLSWDTACITMAAALAKAASRDTIYMVGKVREQLIAPLGVYGVRIVGADTTPRHDLAASWMAPASGSVNSKALIEIIEQGWSFENILFQSQATTAPAVQMTRAEDAVHPDPSHASFINCRFCGCDGILDSGGCYNITIKGCKFYDLTGSAIHYITGAGIAAPQHWHIEDCDFVNNAIGIEHGFKWCVIKRCHFADNTVTINLTGGTAPNFVIENYFDVAKADFDPTGGVTGVDGDVWMNYCTDGLECGLPAD